MAASSSPTPCTGPRTALLPSSSPGLASASSRASPPEWLHRGAGRVDLVRIDYQHKRARSPSPSPSPSPRAKAPRLGPGRVASALVQTSQPPRTPSPSPVLRIKDPHPRPLTPHPASSHCSHSTALPLLPRGRPPSRDESLPPSSPPWLDDSLEVVRGRDDAEDDTNDGGDEISNPFVASSFTLYSPQPPSPPRLPSLRAYAASPTEDGPAAYPFYAEHADIYSDQPMRAEGVWYANAGVGEYENDREYDNDRYRGGRQAETYPGDYNHYRYNPTHDEHYAYYPSYTATPDRSSDGVAWGRDPWGFHTTQRLLRGRATVAWAESNERTRVHEPVVSPITFSPSPSPPPTPQSHSYTPSPARSPPHVSPRYTPPQRPRRTSARAIWRGQRVIDATRGGARIPDPRDVVDDDDDHNGEGFSDEAGGSYDARAATRPPTPQLSPTRRAARDARLDHFALVDAYALHVEIVL